MFLSVFASHFTRTRAVVERFVSGAKAARVVAPFR